MKKVIKQTKVGKTVEEPTWYAETAQYLYESGGVVKHKVENSANEPVTPSEDAERITRVGKLRVETRVFEDNRVVDQSSYCKTINTVQVRNDDEAPIKGSTTPTATNNYEQKAGTPTPAPNDADPSNPLTWAKNQIDQLTNTVRSNGVLGWITFGLATAGFVIAVVAALS